MCYSQEGGWFNESAPHYKIKLRLFDNEARLSREKQTQPLGPPLSVVMCIWLGSVENAILLQGIAFLPPVCNYLIVRLCRETEGRRANKHSLMSKPEEVQYFIYIERLLYIQRKVLCSSVRKKKAKVIILLLCSNNNKLRLKKEERRVFARATSAFWCYLALFSMCTRTLGRRDSVTALANGVLTVLELFIWTAFYKMHPCDNKWLL